MPAQVDFPFGSAELMVRATDSGSPIRTTTGWDDYRLRARKRKLSTISASYHQDAGCCIHEPCAKVTSSRFKSNCVVQQQTSLRRDLGDTFA